LGVCRDFFLLLLLRGLLLYDYLSRLRILGTELSDEEVRLPRLESEITLLLLSSGYDGGR
jgi:hypothetical protein